MDCDAKALISPLLGSGAEVLQPPRATADKENRSATRAHDAPVPAERWPVRNDTERDDDMGHASQRTRLSQFWTLLVNGGLTAVPGWRALGGKPH
jgi:hypothetical protein